MPLKRSSKTPKRVDSFLVESVDSITPDTSSVTAGATPMPTHRERPRKVGTRDQLNALNNCTEDSNNSEHSNKVSTKKGKRQFFALPEVVVDSEEKENSRNGVRRSTRNKSLKGVDLPQSNESAAIGNASSASTRRAAKGLHSSVNLQGNMLLTPTLSQEPSFVQLKSAQKRKVPNNLPGDSKARSSKVQPAGLQLKVDDGGDCEGAVGQSGLLTPGNAHQDLFELVSHTPASELGALMLDGDGGESVLLSQSFAKKMSVMPKLSRTATFTLEEPTLAGLRPHPSTLQEPPRSPAAPTPRKSTRRRWSEVEKTPVFGKNPPSSILKRNLGGAQPPPQDCDNVDLTKGDKSVSFWIPSAKKNSESLVQQQSQGYEDSVIILDKSLSFAERSLKVTKRQQPEKRRQPERRKSEKVDNSRTAPKEPSQDYEDSVIIIDKSTTFEVESPAARKQLTKKRELSEPTAGKSANRTPSKNRSEGLNCEDSVVVIDQSATFHEQSPTDRSEGRKRPKQKKSVKLASPEMTPKAKIQPLAVRKTPAAVKVVFNGDHSILAGNCVAFSPKPGPSASSTPFPARNESTKTKPASRVKLPDFRKIHDRQFEKMESIKDHQDRKVARAQFLLSGVKSNVSSAVTEKESKKKLMFPSPANNLPKPVQEKVLKRASLELQLASKKQKKATDLPKSKIPTGKATASKPQERLIDKRASAGKKPVNRYGFKMTTGVSKEEQLKAVATKTKVGSNLTERNRTQVNAVRTNRRFELLMKMREKEGKKK